MGLFIEIWLTYSILVSGVQHNDSVFVYIVKWSQKSSQHPSLCIIKTFKKYLFIYFAAPDLSCSMWCLVPWPWIKALLAFYTVSKAAFRAVNWWQPLWHQRECTLTMLLMKSYEVFQATECIKIIWQNVHTHDPV